MLSLYYLGYPVKKIEDKEDFFKSGIKEASKIRNFLTICQRIFITTSKNVGLYLLGDKDMYLIDVWDHKKLIARLYYLPKDQRLDLYDGKNPEEPMLMWKAKKCIYKNIPISLETVKAESIFNPLLSVL